MHIGVPTYKTSSIRCWTDEKEFEFLMTCFRTRKHMSSNTLRSSYGPFERFRFNHVTGTRHGNRIDLCVKWPKRHRYRHRQHCLEWVSSLALHIHRQPKTNFSLSFFFSKQKPQIHFSQKLFIWKTKNARRLAITHDNVAQNDRNSHSADRMWKQTQSNVQLTISDSF